MSTEQHSGDPEAAVDAAASGQRNQTRDWSQSTLPPTLDRINRYCHARQNLGIRFTLFNSHYQAAKKRRMSQTEARRQQDPERQLSSPKLSLVRGSPKGTVLVEGSIGIILSDSRKVTKCVGDVLAADPTDGSQVAIVLDVAEKGLIPCRCPVSLLDAATVKALNQRQDYRRTRYARQLQNIDLNSKPATRDGIHGHLLTVAPTGLKGRVVDDKLLGALKAGSLSIGGHSSHAFYTLDRLFLGNIQTLKMKAHTLDASSNGIQLFPAQVSGGAAECIKRCAESAKENLLVYCSTMNDAIERLNSAKEREEVPFHERCIQVGLGGDVQLMDIGSFLPCAGTADNPKIRTRCACGFHVDGLKPGKGLLRRRCSKN